MRRLRTAQVLRWQEERGRTYATDGDGRDGMGGGAQPLPGTDCGFLPQAQRVSMH